MLALLIFKIKKLFLAVRPPQNLTRSLTNSKTKKQQRQLKYSKI